MNRRTLLKGTVAGSAFIVSSRIGVDRTLAQMPSYTAEVIYEFTEFAGESYVVQADGGFQSVSPDGVIAGWDWVDGVLAPVTWDLTGARTALQTGDIAFARSWPLYAGPNGFIAGTLSETDALDSPSLGVLWTNGVPARLDDGGGHDVNVRAVNGNGTAGGNIDGIPSRWTDGKLEQFAVPDGASGVVITSLAENRDGYGVSYDENGLVLSLFCWRADGAVEEIVLPAEMTANSLSHIYSASFPGAFENGDFVMSASWMDASGIASGAWMYQQGQPQAVASSADDTYADVNVALEAGDMFGSMDQASPGSIGFIGPAGWIDGAPYSLKDATTLPADVTYFRVRGATVDGVIVASTFVTSDTPYPAYILALQPLE